MSIGQSCGDVEISEPLFKNPFLQLASFCSNSDKVLTIEYSISSSYDEDNDGELDPISVLFEIENPTSLVVAEVILEGVLNPTSFTTNGDMSEIELINVMPESNFPIKLFIIYKSLQSNVSQLSQEEFVADWVLNSFLGSTPCEAYETTLQQENFTLSDFSNSIVGLVILSDENENYDVLPGQVWLPSSDLEVRLNPIFPFGTIDFTPTTSSVNRMLVGENASIIFGGLVTTVNFNERELVGICGLWNKIEVPVLATLNANNSIINGGRQGIVVNGTMNATGSSFYGSDVHITVGPTGTVTLNDCDFSDARIAGIVVESGGTLIVNPDCVFTNNNTHIEAAPGASVFIADSDFIGGNTQIRSIGSAASSINIFTSEFRYFKECALDIIGNAKNFGFRRNMISDGNIGIKSTDYGIPVISNANIPNIFRNLNTGIEIINGRNPDMQGAIIESNIFENCDVGLYLESCNKVEVDDNVFDCSDVAIDMVRSWIVNIGGKGKNMIGQNQHITGGQPGDYGIRNSFSGKVDVIGNDIAATKTGIEYYLGRGEISSNNIEVNGNNSNLTKGIYTFHGNTLVIENNTISGSGHKVGINIKSLNGGRVINNTFSATGSDHGIAVTGGMGNIMSNNLIESSPTHGIANYSSTANTYNNNNIRGWNNGLMIGHNYNQDVLSTNQTITCNLFCGSQVDMKIASAVGIQRHHNNQFRGNASKVEVLGDPANLSLYRFTYDANSSPMDTDCGVEYELFPSEQFLNGSEIMDPAFNVFNPDQGSSSEDCTATVGSSLVGITDEVLCEEMARFDALSWLAQLQQLLGRYYATHGPQSLPECLELECIPSELFEMEYELRAAMSVDTEALEDEIESDSNLTLKDVAIDHYNRLGGESLPNYESLTPCDEVVEKLEVYTDTYKRLVKQIAFNELDETDMQELSQVAHLCRLEYGEVVNWAQGLLSLHRVEYVDNDCNEEIQLRSLEDSGDMKENDDDYIRLSPVPTDEYLNIAFINAGKGKLLIADMLGNVLKEVGTVDKSHRINTSQLENGSYLISYYQNNMLKETKVFVVLH